MIKPNLGKSLGAIAGSLMALLLSVGIAWADYTSEIISNKSGTAVFELRFHDTEGNNSTWNMSNEQKEALVRAAEYWVERIKPGGTISETMIINVQTFDEYNAGAAPVVVDNSNPTVANEKTTAMHEVVVNGTKPVEDGAAVSHGEINIGKMGFNYNQNTQVRCGSRAGIGHDPRTGTCPGHCQPDGV